MISSPILVKALVAALLGTGALPLVTGLPMPKKPDSGKTDVVAYLKLNWWKLLAGAASIVAIMSYLNILKKR